MQSVLRVCFSACFSLKITDSRVLVTEQREGLEQRGDVSTFSGTFSFLGSQIQVPEGSVAPLEGVLCPDDRAIPTSGGQSPDCVGDAKLCTATGTPARSMDMFDNLMSN